MNSNENSSINKQLNKWLENLENNLKMIKHWKVEKAQKCKEERERERQREITRQTSFYSKNLLYVSRGVCMPFLRLCNTRKTAESLCCFVLVFWVAVQM